MKWVKNLLSLPKPYALPMRAFNLFEEQYTWEDWEREMRVAHPIRYFLSETLPRRCSVWWRTFVTEPIYWLQCHILPSYRFHMLDLRNPGPGIDYTYGYRDPVWVLMAACFVVLRIYIEDEEPSDPALHWTAEEIAADVSLSSQKAHYDEAMTIYNWWMVDRLVAEQEEHRLFLLTKTATTPEEHREYTRVWLDYTRAVEVREDEMLLRLIRIRHSLWT